MPILHSPGVIIPGQLGPMSKVLLFIRALLTFTMSRTGIPSVIHTTNSNSASIASKILSAAYCGGTYIAVAFALVIIFASCTELKTGRPRCVIPPFPGVTPPTILVP